MINDAVKALVFAIKASLSGDAECVFFLSLLKKYDSELAKDKLLSDAYGELSHYITDSDLRANDYNYEVYFKHRIEDYLQKILIKYRI